MILKGNTWWVFPFTPSIFMTMKSITSKPLIGIFSFVFLYLIALNSFGQQDDLKKFEKAIHKFGTKPMDYVTNRLEKSDLLVFDDGFHSALEPFIFYEDMVKNKVISEKLDFIFIEVFHMDTQDNLDAYFAAPEKDFSLLHEVFQNDYSGYGWPYESYLNLLSVIWDIRQTPSLKNKLQVIAVSPPIYWKAIETRRDYDVFLKTLDSRDYFMYHEINTSMENFKQGKKGVFLTNTRHAYKNIKNKEGETYWNTNTFFNHFNPGRTFSIRFHNLFLSIVEKRVGEPSKNSAEGLENFEFNWVQAANGLWERAFLNNNQLPVGLGLKNNVFGKTPYLGNHALNMQKQTLMSDAYDGLIFLKPVEEMKKSERTAFFITEEFKKELKRRIEILEGEGLSDFLKTNNAGSLEEWIDTFSIISKTK